jgi:hypothetical protein
MTIFARCIAHYFYHPLIVYLYFDTGRRYGLQSIRYWCTIYADWSRDPQTREHILLECPDYAEARARHLVESLTDEVVSLRVLLGTLEGDVRLLGFLEDTNAFFKTRRSRAAQPPEADEDSGEG